MPPRATAPKPAGLKSRPPVNTSSPLSKRHAPNTSQSSKPVLVSAKSQTGKRRRNRKARTEVSSSESDSSDEEDGSSSSSSGGSDGESKDVELPVKKVKVAETKARVSSSSEAEDSSDESMSDADANESSLSASSSDDDDDDDDSQDEGKDRTSTRATKAKAKPTRAAPTSSQVSIPAPLRKLNASTVEKEFEDYYLKKLTEEFGDDLNSVRQSKDFNEKSLPMLVRALKSGAKGFDEADKRTVLGTS